MESKKKKKQDLASRPLELLQSKQSGPWPEFREGAAFVGRNPVALVPGGEGEVGEELVGVETYRFVGSVRAGGCRRGVVGGAGVGAAVSSR